MKLQVVKPVHKMIKISPGFQYSINLKYDIDNPHKISSYIPTEKTMLLLEQLIDALLDDSSNERARMIIGPYGTGKSHFFSVFGALIKGYLSTDVFAPLFDKLSASGAGELINKYTMLINDKPYLTVVISGDGKSIEQSFIKGLRQSLESAGLEVSPITAYIEVEKKINAWRDLYPSTYNDFLNLLENQYLNEQKFKKMLLDCNETALELFSSLYPRLTAGAEFNPYHVENIAELYLDIAKKIQDYYNGIYVIFDEFNKHLEAAVKNNEALDLKPLQDFAEMCNRSEASQVHLTLISHQHISQYASKLSEELLNEWRKVEGRFKNIELSQHSSKTYNLISQVIIKEPNQWEQYQHNYAPFFQELKEKAMMFGIFKDLNERDLERWVIKGCFPLHPCTTFCLPRLSNKIAQNERTVFTFLATNDFNTLGKFLEENAFEDMKLVGLDYLFDYFASAMKKMTNNDPIYKVWLQTSEAIQKIKEPNHLSLKILKALGIIIGLGEEQSLPATERVLQFSLALNPADDGLFKEELNKLASEKIIYIRKSDGKIEFFRGSDVDVDAEISKIKTSQRYQSLFDLSSILNEHFMPYPIIANRYNDKYEMIRFFMPQYYTSQKIKKGIDWDAELTKQGYLDGILCLIIAEDEESISDIKEIHNRTCHEQVVWAITKKPLYFNEIVFDYLALDLLKRDQEFLQNNPHVEVELNAYLDDYSDQIELMLSKLIDPQQQEVIYLYQGEEFKNIDSSAKLSQLVSKICENVFFRTPLINNEMINKSQVTKTIANARKKVNEKIITENEKENLGLVGHGPDMSIFKAVLKRTGVYRLNKSKAILKEPEDDALKEILSLITKIIHQSTTNEIFVGAIYDILQRPPYGIRKGIIPIMLALCLKEIKEFLLIKDQRGLEAPLSASLLEQIASKPEQYALILEEWGAIKESYVKQLTELFSDFIDHENNGTNKIFPIAAAMKKWYISLPKISRHTRKISEEARALRITLNNPALDSKSLIFERLPGNYSMDESVFFIEHQYEQFIKKIRKGKLDLEKHKDDLLDLLKTDLIEIFCNGETTFRQGCFKCLQNWHFNLKDSTKNHLFSNIVSGFLELIANHAQYQDDVFVEECARVVIGLNINDWSDELHTSFTDRIIEIKESVELFDHQEDVHQNTNLIAISFFANNGQKQELTFKKEEISELGESLLNVIDAHFETYSESISINEKRQVLINLLEKFSK